MPHDLTDTLNDLISTCRDSQEGFSKAAKGVHSDALRRLFMDVFDERGRFAADLQDYVRRIGASPADRPHGSSTLQRGWVELETNIRPKDDMTFIANCLEGEESTLRHYESALTTEGMDGPLRAALEHQHRRVRDTLNEIRCRQSEYQHV